MGFLRSDKKDWEDEYEYVKKYTPDEDGKDKILAKIQEKIDGAKK